MGEYARQLLVRIHTDQSFNATWGPYLASLPKPDELLTGELMTDEMLEMLQHPGLVSTLLPACPDLPGRLHAAASKH